MVDRTRHLVIGCGYLGHRVAKAWQSARCLVSALTRSAERAAQFERQGIQPILGDICDSASLPRFPVVDTILFAVGHDRSSGKSQSEVYVDGLKNALDKVSAARRLIYVSSSSVYGQSDGEWVDEDSQCHPVQSGGESCLAAESVLRQFCARQDGHEGMLVNILRLSGIYGPGRLLTRIESLRGEAPIAGRGNAWLNLIHVDDAVAAVLACEQKGKSGQTYLVTDNCPIRRDEYFGLLAKLVNAPPPVFDGMTPPRRGSGGLNKRCSNRLIREQLGLKLRYPTINEGLIHALSEADPGSILDPRPGE